MVFGSGKSQHRELTADQLASMLNKDEALVVDVREPKEFAEGHIPGALNMPLSNFDPFALPHPEGKKLVLNCAGGKRSAMALDQCGVAETAVDTHLAGGFGAWKSAGLPVER